ncbi:imelysin family protein [Cellulophaga baltica]|uniref:imelysin family protein n=1 Tax=Cellulophaga TaxID=104264 RepID=UPI001C065D9D|nr:MULTISPECIES: imelysin family protein [Cellulophaga]MBU2996802.1 imelysin family protein [Cellulophaga baltica]MDO6768198.1 imelysin family protein [Cellulophaga sp. 1_MG-2023]
MKKIISTVVVFMLLFSCVEENDDNTTEGSDDFDRTLILNNWVDNIILPAYDAFEAEVSNLKTAETAFVSSPSEATLTTFQTSLFETQKAWQHVAMFDLGLDVNATATYREFMNSYPVDVTEVDASLDTTVDDIAIISFDLSIRADEQGLPTLDYLLNGVDLDKYTTDDQSEVYSAYVTKVVDRIVSLTSDVTSYWNTNAVSIKSDGGSSATSSFNILFNDYLFYVEQGFREAKIATPSGSRTGGASKDPMFVESFYTSENSKILFLEAYEAVENLYFGISFDGNSDGESIDSYIEFLNPDTIFDSVTLQNYSFSDFISLKLSDIDEQVDLLNDDFTIDVENNNDNMIDTFTVIQNYVVFLKTNVVQTIGVTIDFADSDGD